VIPLREKLSMVQRRHWIFIASIAMVLVGALVAVLLRPGSEPEPSRASKPTSGFQVSYAGAAARLDGLDKFEAQEQLRDWARFGLATQLGLTTAQLRDALYDTLPVRDNGFADVARQPTGPGRALPDGAGTLHLLTQSGDPQENQTLGMLLDQYRADSGADPVRVRVHHYEILPDARLIQLSSDDPLPAGEFRSELGYVTMRVDDGQALTDFLGRTTSLSTLEVKGAEIWASGWSWPSDTGASTTFEDVSVLQRGYLPSQAGPRPGFSLDPGPPESKEDLRAVLPGLSPELADRILSDDWSGSPFRSAQDLADVVRKVLILDDPAPAGLPSDRTQLWGLSSLLQKQGSYAQARYDGGLAGTEAGMTLFYTDYVAKDWVKGVGSGVPTEAVGGFVPDPDANLPWSQCRDKNETAGESGRLWFGQNDSAFAFIGNRVDIGAQATRLFARSDGGNGKEVEQSLGFGQGLRWWDRHYQDVAAYEPQYRRLDQLMRWSGALDWLTARTSARLPQLADDRIKVDLRFQDWYTQHNELRERAPIAFVAPPSAKTEALLTKPSKVTPSCGARSISGGVSLADINAREGSDRYHANLPGPINRAGPVDPASTFDTTTQTGSIKGVTPGTSGKFEPALEREFSPTADGGAEVRTAAGGKREISHGALKEYRSDSLPRRIGTVLKVALGQYSHGFTLQDRPVGELTAQKQGDLVTVHWRRGPVDRARTFLESLQARLTAQPNAPWDSPDGAVFRYDQPGGKSLYRLGDHGDLWLTVTDETKPPGDELAFRLGAPDPNTGGARFLVGMLVPHPGPPATPWIKFVPGTGDRSASVTPADPPPPDAVKLRISTPDGKTSSTVYVVDGHVVALADDPVAGLDGSVEAAAFLQRYPEAAKAIVETKQASADRYRPFPLDGDGVALAGKDEVRVLPVDHPWAARVLSTLGRAATPYLPWLRIRGDTALLVGENELADAPGVPLRHEELGTVLAAGGPHIYVHEEFRTRWTHQDGLFTVNAVPRDVKVTVRTTVLAPGVDRQSLVARPEIRTAFGAEWSRADPPVPLIGHLPNQAQTSPTTTSPTTIPGYGNPQAPADVVLLVCPEIDQRLIGCGQ
jgi:hypothetical protein